MLPPCAWSTPLQRTFTSFPSGWVGAALLVLRVVVGTSAIVEAALAIARFDSLLSWVTASSAALAGLALLLGFLTPIAGALIAAESAVILLSMHAVVLQLLDSRMALFELVVMAAALAILGPGAASIDARLFGRREVAISEERRPNDL
jgi:putative oxidoreductase